MTKPGYKEEPSLKVSFSRHVMCIKEKPNIKICTTLDPQTREQTLGGTFL